MQIRSISNNYYTPYRQKTCQNQSFGAWYRDVYSTIQAGERGFGVKRYSISNKKVSNIIYRNNTLWFRGDDELPQIMDAIVKLHKDTPQVHTRFYGCSIGAENYSVYMYLMSKYGENIISKFKPFKAMDIDVYAIEKAKDGAIPVNYDEFLKIQKNTNDRFNEFFHGKELGIPNKHLNPRRYYPRVEKIFSGANLQKDSLSDGTIIMLKHKYLKDIEYSVADIMDDYKNIEPKNSVTFIRNFLPYLTDDEIVKLIKGLGKRLKKDSCIVFGQFDFSPDRAYSFRLKDLLYDNGFEKLDTGGFASNLVFRKT